MCVQSQSPLKWMVDTEIANEGGISWDPSDQPPTIRLLWNIMLNAINDYDEETPLIKSVHTAEADHVGAMGALERGGQGLVLLPMLLCKTPKLTNPHHHGRHILIFLFTAYTSTVSGKPTEALQEESFIGSQQKRVYTYFLYLGYAFLRKTAVCLMKGPQVSWNALHFL